MKKRAFSISLFFAYAIFFGGPVIEGHEQHHDNYDLSDRNREGRDFSEYDYGSPEADLHRNNGGYFYRRYHYTSPQ